MADLWLEPYEEALGDFPLTASSREKLKSALASAVWAPSVHNTQPWWCRIRSDTIEIHADRARLLEVSDPNGRELTISCGALVEYLSIVLARFGQDHNIEILPRGPTADLIARLTLGETGRPDPASIVLYDAISARRTNRQPFQRRSVPAPAFQRAAGNARLRGTDLQLIESRPERTALADLIARADRLQMADGKFRQELGRWLRVPGTRRPDGIPAPNGKAPLALRPLAPLVVRTFDIGGGIAAQDRRVAAGSPVLAVLCTRADDPSAWVAAGRGLARLLLSLAADRVATSFLNSPVEVPEIRAELESALALRASAQIVLRAGYAKPVARTPRRPLTEILRR
ncbi:MAG: hypothetical protein ABI647_18660 [Gemmatimonadota bacterium]